MQRAGSGATGVELLVKTIFITENAFVGITGMISIH